MSIVAYCNGEGCPKKQGCLRFVTHTKKPRIKSKTCIALGFDLFVHKEKGVSDGTSPKRHTNFPDRGNGLLVKE